MATSKQVLGSSSSAQITQAAVASMAVYFSFIYKFPLQSQLHNHLTLPQLLCSHQPLWTAGLTDKAEELTKVVWTL